MSLLLLFRGAASGPTIISVDLNASGVAGGSLISRSLFNATYSYVCTATDSLATRVLFNAVYVATGTASDSITSRAIWNSVYSAQGLAMDSLISRNIYSTVVTVNGIATDSINSLALYRSDLNAAGVASDNLIGGSVTIVTADLNASGQSITDFVGEAVVAIEESVAGGGGSGNVLRLKYKQKIRKKQYAFLDDIGIEEVYEKLVSNSETQSDVKKLVKPYVKNQEIDFDRLLENVEKIEQLLALYRELQQAQEDEDILLLMYG